MKLVPLGQNVVLREVKQEATTASGIILTEGTSRDASTWVVSVVGPEVIDICTGQVVSVNWSKGKVVKLESIDYLIIPASEVLAIIE